MGNTDSHDEISELWRNVKCVFDLVTADYECYGRSIEIVCGWPPIDDVDGEAIGDSEDAGDSAVADPVPVVDHVKGGFPYACEDQEVGDINGGKIAASCTGEIVVEIEDFVAGAQTGAATGGVVGGAAMHEINTEVGTTVNGK